MDIFQSIENDTFDYGGISAKQSKYPERPQLMIVLLPIAGIQVHLHIQIIQLFNCYTSETKKYVCPSLTQSSVHH